AREGTRRADGPIFPRIGMVETAETAKQHAHYTTPLFPSGGAGGGEPASGVPLAGSPPPHRGRGVASGFWFNCGLKSSASASVNADGTVSLVEGSTDIGGTRTSLAMPLAEALGIRAEDVRPVV